MSKKKKEVKEIIPEGMKREDYADAAFRKKVTIIMGCVLLAFILLVCGVIFGGWYKREQENKEFDRLAAIFQEEKNDIKSRLSKIEKFEDKSKVKIEVTDDNFHDWLAVLDASYQLDSKDENYAAFGGATIHIQGKFLTKEFKGGNTQYWLYRNHDHGDGHHDHENGDDSEGMLPIQLIFLDENTKIPKNGTWVDVTGIVGPDTFKSLSAVRDAEMTIMDEPGQQYVK